MVLFFSRRKYLFTKQYIRLSCYLCFNNFLALENFHRNIRQMNQVLPTYLIFSSKCDSLVHSGVHVLTIAIQMLLSLLHKKSKQMKHSLLGSRQSILMGWRGCYVLPTDKTTRETRNKRLRGSTGSPKGPTLGLEEMLRWGKGAKFGPFSKLRAL